MYAHEMIWLFPTYGHADPPPLKSCSLKKWLRKVLNRTGKIIQISPIFIFLVIIENWGDFFQKNDTKIFEKNSKNKNLIIG